MKNVDVMRPKANYQLVLYCNPNLKSLSGKDKIFTEEFQNACGKIPCQFSSDLPTIEKLTSIPTTEDSRAMIIIGTSNFDSGGKFMHNLKYFSSLYR